MFFVIKGYDEIYGGMHGMVNFSVIEADEVDDFVIACAKDESCDVISSYSEIWDVFEDSAHCEGLEEGTDEWDDFIAEQEEDDIAFDIYKVTTDIYSFEEIENILHSDPDRFIEEYCEIA